MTVYNGAPHMFKADGKYRKDDEWGMKVFTDTDDKPEEGAVVKVTTKRGTERTERIRKVIWSGENNYGEGWVHFCLQDNGESNTPASQANDYDFSKVFHSLADAFARGDLKQASEVCWNTANDLEAGGRREEPSVTEPNDEPVPF